MRVRIADEIKWSERCVARINTHPLEPQRQENWPQDIRELCGDEQHGERDLWGDTLGRESKSKMSDEHSPSNLSSTRCQYASLETSSLRF